MDLFRSIFRPQNPQQAPVGQPGLVESPACVLPFSTVDNGQHYIWRGIICPESERVTTVGVYDPHTELWSLKPTTGPTPPGQRNGGCVAVGGNLYSFGGHNGRTHFNNLYKLNLQSEPLQWTEIKPKNDPLEWPLCKTGCGLVSVDEGQLLGCFGGHFKSHRQPGFVFAGSEPLNGPGWTQEFHLFDLQEGVWFTPGIKGHKPACSHFSFTKIDRHRAVLFGGYQCDWAKVNDLYLFDFRNMEVTRVESATGEPWPEERARHAACCLNYDESHPMVLMYGGVGNNRKLLGDMWILDVDAGKWIEVIPPESVKPRESCSITATSLGPGLTEVLIFGGKLVWGGHPIAETIILRFEWTAPSVAGPSTGMWALVDVACNNTRGSKERIKEKTAKIREANQNASSDGEPTDQPLRDKGRSLEQQLREMTRDAERIAAEISIREQTTQRRLQEVSQEAEQQAMEADRRILELTNQLQDMERRAQLAEQRVDSLETQWVVQHEEIHLTERELGEGGWGIVKVAKFRGIEVAAKSLYKQIQSDYYRDLFIREMNMAARLRHPNLVQFIGATLDREMIILTELMHTSLRRVLEGGRISHENTVSISAQVCQALNYLHLMQPDPVIHRDISSANVLLNPLPNSCWRAKVTDYGSVNTLRSLQTENPGNPVYAAPEAKTPSLQSTKMDIFSVGVLLIEMHTGRFPSDDTHERLLYTIQDQQFLQIIRRCIDCDKDNRPTALELLNELV